MKIPKVLILAKNGKQAMDWLRGWLSAHELQPLIDSGGYDFYPLVEAQEVLGRHNCLWVRVGQWYLSDPELRLALNYYTNNNRIREVDEDKLYEELLRIAKSLSS